MNLSFLFQFQSYPTFSLELDELEKEVSLNMESLLTTYDKDYYCKSRHNLP